MDFFLSAPALLKVLVSLGLILVMNRFSRNLTLSVLAGTVLLAFLAGHTVESFFLISWNRLIDSDNLFLIIIIFLILWMSNQMSKTGIMDSLVTSFQSKVSNRTSMALLPALVGLLPMPGGALFSAPLVDDCDSEKAISPMLKGKINYWFRHIWEYWWPLYAGVLLAVEISGLEIGHFIFCGIPVTLFSILGGWLFLLRKVEKREKNGSGTFDISSLFPVFLVIAVYVLTGTLFPVLTAISKFLPIALGIITAMIYLQIKHPLSSEVWKKITLSKKTLNLTVLVVIIRIYGAFIEAPLPSGEYLVDLMRTELERTGIPAISLIMLLPFISGFTTGIALGMVGASFPIVMQLTGADPSTSQLMSTAILAYAAGHVGQLVSPVHVCLIVTNEYFETSLLKSIRGIIGPCLFVIGGGLLVSQIVLLF